MHIYDSIQAVEEQPLDNTKSQYYVYIIINSNDLIKIGKTKNPKQRFGALSGSNSCGLELCKFIVFPQSYIDIEKMAHTHFHKYRIAGSEWFKGVSEKEVCDFLLSIYAAPSFQTIDDTYRQKEEQRLLQKVKVSPKTVKCPYCGKIFRASAKDVNNFTYTGVCPECEGFFSANLIQH